MKIIKRMSFLILMICSLFMMKRVQAGSLDTYVTVDWMNGVYANRKVNGLNYYNQMGFIYTNGVLSYCLESTKFITEDVYHSTTDFSRILTDEQRDYVELLAYYGYGYQYNYREFYLASQELIWEYLEGVDVYFTTESKGQGNVINLEPYKQNILYLIRTHSSLPVFKDQVYRVKEGEKWVQEDTHHTLERYELDKAYKELSIQGNQLHFESGTYGIYEFGMHMKTRNPISFLYFKGDSQTIGSFGLRKNQPWKFKIINEPKEHTLKLQKVDQRTKEPIKQAGIQFKIKNMDLDQYLENGKIYETDEQGVIKTGKILPGHYKIEEITPPGGYYGKIEMVVTIDENTPYKEESFYIEFGNEPFRSKIQIHKQGDHLISMEHGIPLYQTDDLEGVSFDVVAKEDIYDGRYLYYSKNDVVDVITTDAKGHAETKNLPYGTYCLRETKTNIEFELDQTCHEVILPEPTIEEVKKIELKNERKRTELKLYKQGEIFSVSKNQYFYERMLLEQIVFELYAGEDITENGHFIFKEGDLITEIKTDKQGYLSLDSLPYGKYVLKEKVPKEYEEEKALMFVFDPDHTVQEFHLVNHLKKGSVLIKKIDEETKKPLKGVKIGIYTKDGQLIYTGVTNEQGIISLNDLAYGEYYIQEIASLATYELNDQTYSFTLDEEQTSYQLELPNHKIDYPNTLTSPTVSFLKSIVVFALCVGLLKRYLA